MTTLEFTSSDIRAGYGEHGFAAFGQTDTFRFDSDHDPLPSFRGIAFRWNIAADDGNAWKEYEEIVSVNQEKITSREAEIKKVLGEKPCGMLLRWQPDKVSLSFHLPADPAFASFIMGIIAARRSLHFYCSGFHFTHDGNEEAAAPSISGFMDRREPLFISDHPILSIR